MTRVLVLEPNDSSRRRLQDALAHHGFDVVAAARLDAAPRAAAGAVDAIVANARLFAECLLDFAGPAPVVVAADAPSIAHAVECMRQGAADYLPQPIEPSALRAAVARAARRNLPEPAANADFAPMVGHCAAMRTLFARIRELAATDAPVLIQGESGTGKELVARALHTASRRWQGQLIVLNCAAVRDTLIEAELFGHRGDGSFRPAFAAGATAQRRGLMELARGGTLLVDEIGEMPLGAQARLLRFLDDGRTDADAPPADVRLVATTHRDLAQLTETGHFDGNLHTHLRGAALHVPPLRERGEDVVAIANAVLERSAAKQGKNGLSFATSALDAMRGYAWPGNVRELENAVERAAILCDGATIDAHLLAIDVGRPPPPSPQPRQPETSGSLEDFFVRFVLDNQDQLTETELAGRLGISRKSLWERRQRLNIPRRRTRKRGPRRDQR